MWMGHLFPSLQIYGVGGAGQGENKEVSKAGLWLHSVTVHGLLGHSGCRLRQFEKKGGKYFSIE